MTDNQKIFEIITGINNIFSLQRQGKELVSLISKVLKCPGLCLLFLDNTGEIYTVLASKPVLKNNHFTGIAAGIQDSTAQQVVKHGRVISRNSDVFFTILGSISGYSKEKIETDNIELMVPLISGERLIGIIIIEKKDSGEYAPEDITLLYDIAVRLAPGMEREYLRFSLIEREKELSVLIKCCTTIYSSLDISDVYDDFIRELKKLIEIDWAAITLIDGDSMNVLASYSGIGTSWWTGERMLVKGTATEWVATSRMPVVEADIQNESLFVTDVYYREQGIRSLVCLPLLVDEEEVIGSLIVGSCRPDSYNSRLVEYLSEIALLVTLPVKNALLYAEVLKKSRYDELTGLLNRRSMDEQIISEVNRHSRYGGVFSLIILDLDSMKLINDTFGHLAGDGVLSRTGSILKEAIRSVDQAFRYGGDEFAILLPNTPAEAAVKVSERVRKRIAAKLVVDNMTITASFGLASWPENGTKANDVVAAADAALYKAKKLGRNQSRNNKEA
jgi:diguanylate cyclase (GGDEF)-like protein